MEVCQTLLQIQFKTGHNWASCVLCGKLCVFKGFVTDLSIFIYYVWKCTHLVHVCVCVYGGQRSMTDVFLNCL